jgi:hypothetical protein
MRVDLVFALYSTRHNLKVGLTQRLYMDIFLVIARAMILSFFIMRERNQEEREFDSLSHANDEIVDSALAIFFAPKTRDRLMSSLSISSLWGNR